MVEGRSTGAHFRAPATWASAPTTFSMAEWQGAARLGFVIARSPGLVVR